MSNRPVAGFPRKRKRLVDKNARQRVKSARKYNTKLNQQTGIALFSPLKRIDAAYIQQAVQKEKGPTICRPLGSGRHRPVQNGESITKDVA